MKKFIFLTLISLCANWLGAQYYLVDTLRLNKAYAVLMAKPESIKAQQEYFDAFPHNWVEFFTTYSYEPAPQGFDATMARKLDGHRMAFMRNLPLIDDSLYCARVANLVINSQDRGLGTKEIAENALQERTEAMIKIVSTLTDGDQLLFWASAWGNPLPIHGEKLHDYINDYMKDRYPEETETMNLAFRYFYGYTMYMDFLDDHVDQKKYTGRPGDDLSKWTN